RPRMAASTLERVCCDSALPLLFAQHEYAPNLCGFLQLFSRSFLFCILCLFQSAQSKNLKSIIHISACNVDSIARDGQSRNVDLIAFRASLGWGKFKFKHFV